MANSPARHAKRRRSSVTSCGSSSHGDSKRQHTSIALNDDYAPLDNHEAAFDEAMAYSEDLATQTRDVSVSGMSGTKDQCEEEEVDYGETGGNFAENGVHDSGGSSSDIVCFGTISSLHGRCSLPRSSVKQFPVTITSSESFHATENEALCGWIPPQYGSMMHGLLMEKSLQSSSHSQTSCSLDLTVYGPKELFEEIGEWLQEHNVYLQDPRTPAPNGMDVKYWNPHRLSSTDLESCPFVSQVILLGSGLAHFQEIEEQPDLLDIISGQDDLEETSAPKSIRATLHRHQKQALTYMLRREKGWALETKGTDMWEALDSSNGRKFINRVSNSHQDNPPPDFHGGIIADPMGLGKTLTMLALAATDLEPVSSSITQNDFLIESEHLLPITSATLVIMPQPLLSAWEEQIRVHVVLGSMKVRRHHGKERVHDIEKIDETNMILTTYHTVSADWQKRKSFGSTVLFSVKWKRIILDEAHLIRNMKTRMARAICDLESASRWAVTGTPIQNSLSDLSALLKFIRAYPYEDPKRFAADISLLWKSGEDEEAVNRLKRLSRCLILRRAKRTVTLPSRRDVRCPVEFSKAERDLYESIRNQTIKKLEDAMTHGAEFSQRGLYVNFLQQIESMRLVCSLGTHYTTRHDKLKYRDKNNWADNAQEAFNIRREMMAMRCSQCSSSLDVGEILGDEGAPQDTPHFFECLKYACAECSGNHRIHKTIMSCGHKPPCSIAPVSVSNSALEEVFCNDSEDSTFTHSVRAFPSKVEALISDLKQQPKDVKSIVFSTWRLTLDIVETALEQSHIRSVRFDGKVLQSQRQPVLDEFRSRPDVRVILLTLQCGAVGLTLTEASRAYLMEPHWNPTVEEQALARIHRIGQKREVTTVRFYIRDSFEERVIETQKSKKNLASVLLSGHDGGQADNSLAALQASDKNGSVRTN
ncbi:SNF2 family N-terminal domain containing protein [Pyrenophora tritici-repentis]|nr:SNF2 family N-terminal domain containing protein [Pyrenophora tritici-repentis]